MTTVAESRRAAPVPATLEATKTAASPLTGRKWEIARLNELVHSAVTGHGAGLVVRGVAGIGKSALLAQLAELSPAHRVIRLDSAAAEANLPYSALHQLCSELSHELQQLESHHRQALETAIGRRPADGDDRLLTCVALVELLSRAAEPQPLVCLVDNAQWTDRASADALAFAVRRLSSVPAALVFASRVSCFASLPELLLEGLEHAGARWLFESALPAPLDERVVDRMVVEADGNPRTLLESARSSSPSDLAGGYGVVVPAQPRDTTAVESLTHDGKLLLLLAAAEPLGDPVRLLRAAAQLGIDPPAADEVRSAGLLSFGAWVTFPDPRWRGSYYGTASAADRRRAHGALAAVTDPAQEPDIHAWHLVHSRVDPDDAIGDGLASAAAIARDRGGRPAQAAFLERAATYTVDPRLRTARAVAAADVSYAAGAADTAARLLATAELGSLGAADRARADHLRAVMEFDLHRSPSTVAGLVESAKGIELINPQLARPAYLEALSAAIFTGQVDAIRTVLPRLAEETPKGSDRLLEGVIERCTGGYAGAVESLKLALKTLDSDHEESARSRVLACLVAADLWDDGTWHDLTAAEVDRARRSGSRSVLPYFLTHRALVEIHTGHFDVARSLVAEARTITDATGRPPFPHAEGVLAAWRGEAPHELSAAAERGAGSMRSLAQYATAVLGNGTGHYARAAEATRDSCMGDRLELQGWSVVEFIEAAVRSGDRDAASTALERLSDHAFLTGTEWALGVEARSRALLREGRDAEDLYLEAIERLNRSCIATQLARTQLVYGEWLRRQGRRIDARKELRAAYDAFAGMGANAFAGRALRELLATGERARRRTAGTSSRLTPQEQRIASLARDGRSNPEIASVLSISPRTVEYHLHKVFSKLMITSRNQLHLVLASSET
ncbi:AAA family ATPase [Amycolatopsis sp. NPDC051903]|uniref:helix-turn-helix transcriptional regulator n=1 Tax=Amycolatopsis sp. NPDC051903 TaxID=3363936 RepID=UPI0037ADD74B